ncbi:hypothetical protein G6O69_19320 [Pseudenhygromyxa sp. WMMC2535]|uniref:hypothetical protein n=1 Tax=Pseudenhygromyxa sp. WMMC2535 TaxID=2712867 RepID=UPI001555933E|nr:hypothetical protein [Pseudenhygromyxa sp. WMMC2535]NVB40004.1 hypothetical protein [Pseudenhygromyxa sp. WMMC2535]
MSDPDGRDDLSALEPIASRSGAFSPSPSDSLRETLDDEDIQSGMSMAELKAQLEREREATAKGNGLVAFELRRNARPGSRDDELLDAPPRGEHHLGRLGGWNAGRRSRQLIAAGLGLAMLAGIVAIVRYEREIGHRRLHPLPEVEATIAPGTPREMSLSEGKFRVGLGREAPAINVVHLPDRDLTLAPGADKAQFKIEVIEGRTTKIQVLTGEIQESLRAADAEPLL